MVFGVRQGGFSVCGPNWPRAPVRRSGGGDLRRKPPSPRSLLSLLKMRDLPSSSFLTWAPVAATACMDPISNSHFSLPPAFGSMVRRDEHASTVSAGFRFGLMLFPSFVSLQRCILSKLNSGVTTV